MCILDGDHPTGSNDVEEDRSPSGVDAEHKRMNLQGAGTSGYMNRPLLETARRTTEYLQDLRVDSTLFSGRHP